MKILAATTKGKPGAWQWLAYAALAFFTFLMARITLEYFPLRDDAAFLQIKQQYIHISHWMLAFWIHVYSSMLALVAGFTQFAPSVLRNKPGLHRWMGRVYVGIVCFVTGPSGLIMAFYANGGISSRLAFGILSVLWLGTTALAWRAVLQRQWITHRDWMIRSYALTLSAITLRAWKYGIVMVFEPRPMDAYRLVAWLGFVPNLLAAEWIIRRLHRKKPGHAVPAVPPAIMEMSA